MRATKREAAKACLKKIRTQCPDTPEAKFMFTVFERAVFDLFSPVRIERDTAAQYVCGPMPHLQEIGISPQYVRMVFRRAGIYFKSEEISAAIQEVAKKNE